MASAMKASASSGVVMRSMSTRLWLAEKSRLPRLLAFVFPSGTVHSHHKKAVRDRGGDPGDGYRQALRDRFLCRVFSDPDGRFILKGGSGLLARIPDGRATRDIDFGGE